jgi:hypothetical protein
MNIAMDMGGKNSSIMLQLAPQQVVKKLEEFVVSGRVDGGTLFVWDIDDTLIQAGSDYSFNGAQAIRPEFSEIIRKTRSLGAMHIALTNASPFDNILEIKGGVLELTPIPQVAERATCPSYFQGTTNSGGSLTFENLRIAGLRHIDIDLTNSELQKIPRELPITQFQYDTEQDPVGKELAKIIDRDGRVLETWTDSSDQKVYRHIQWDSMVPGFAPDHRKRHFIRSGNSLSEVLCKPIFSGGIIFCNFINLYTQCYYGYIKGLILRSFLNEWKKQIGRKFSNVIFIDDTFTYVENVVQVMGEMGIPCTGIHILSH